MNKKLVFLIVIASGFLLSCKSVEKARKKDLKGEKNVYLMKQMERNKIHFNTINFKAKVHFKNEKENKSFKANFRLQKDSAIWISISPALGIELARVLITEDTVKVINRFGKDYFIGDYSYINKRFNIELEFQLLQALLLGNPIDLESDDELNFATDKNFYFLGNLKKRKARKAQDKPQKIERKDEEVFSIWLEPNNFKIRKVLVSDLTADRFLQGEYSNYIQIQEQLFPQELFFNFQSENPSELKMEYSKIEFNEKLSFPFTIPSKYEQVLY